MACDDCGAPQEGDVVEHIMNTDVFGVVIGFMGSLVAIRISPSLNVLWFHSWELREVGDDEYHGDGGKEDVPVDNVVDFTKAVADLKKAKTKGVA